MSTVEKIDAATLKDWLDNDEAVLIDVREIDEYKAAHIKGSILIPVGECVPSVVPRNPDKKIVFHCKAGIRGGKACEACAQGMDERVVYNLDGGIDAWISQGFPVIKDAS